MLFGAARRRNVPNFVVLKNVPNTGTRIELAAVSIVRDFSFELTGSKGSVGRITSHLGEDISPVGSSDNSDGLLLVKTEFVDWQHSQKDWNTQCAEPRRLMATLGHSS